MGIDIELFPLQVTGAPRFDIKNFYSNMISFDEDEINDATGMVGTKIMEISRRIR